MIRTVALLVAALAVLVVLPDLAFAEDVPIAIPTNLGVWPAVATAACAGVLWALRYFSKAGFLHTPTGVAVGTLGAVVVSAIQPVIAARGIDGRAIIFAALGAFAAGLAMSNPSGTPAEKLAPEANS